MEMILEEHRCSVGSFSMLDEGNGSEDNTRNYKCKRDPKSEKTILEMKLKDCTYIHTYMIIFTTINFY